MSIYQYFKIDPPIPNVSCSCAVLLHLSSLKEMTLCYSFSFFLFMYTSIITLENVFEQQTVVIKIKLKRLNSKRQARF